MFAIYYNNTQITKCFKSICNKNKHEQNGIIIYNKLP